MDNFVKAFFPGFVAPGMERLPLNQGGTFNTHLVGAITITHGDYRGPARTRYRQSMTVLGKSAAEYGGTASSLEGINSNLVRADGTLDADVMINLVRSSSSAPLVGLNRQVAIIRAMDWSDNHVPLLVNALRAYYIQYFGEGANEGSLPRYEGEGVSVNRDQWWGNYPNVNVKALDSWPGGENILDYPSVTDLQNNTPTVPIPALDFTGLDEEEVGFMLMMCGTWTRSSRMKLDFTLPKLAAEVYIRKDCRDTQMQRWRSGVAGVQRPDVPDEEVMLSAITKYVERNRLYSHYAAANYVIMSMMMQMVPQTMEGQAWLDLEWRVKLPELKSIRGRYPFLLAGRPATSDLRPSREWAYFNGDASKVVLASACLVQAVQTGLAVRSVKRGLYDEPIDIVSTQHGMALDPPFLAAAASEATGRPCPMSGFTNVTVTIPQFNEEYDSERTIALASFTQDARRKFDITGTAAAGRAAVPWMSFAGTPTMIMPISPFDFETGMSLRGELDPNGREIKVRGLVTPAAKAWQIASMYQPLYYGTNVETYGGACGRKQFATTDQESIVMPIMMKPGHQNRGIVVTGFTDNVIGWRRTADVAFYNSKSFGDDILRYSTSITRRGVSTGTGTIISEILEIENIGGVDLNYERCYTPLLSERQCSMLVLRSQGALQYQVEGGQNATEGQGPNAPGVGVPHAAGRPQAARNQHIPEAAAGQQVVVPVDDQQAVHPANGIVGVAPNNPGDDPPIENENG